MADLGVKLKGVYNMIVLVGVLVSARVFGMYLGGGEQADSFFSVIGDAAIFGNSARILINKEQEKENENAAGGIQSLGTIETGLFELEVVFNVTTQNKDKAGVSWWFASRAQELGPIFGLSREFRGFGVFLEVRSSTVYLSDIGEMSESNVRSGEKCLIALQNTNGFRFYVKRNTFELWIHQDSLTKCAEVIQN